MNTDNLIAVITDATGTRSDVISNVQRASRETENGIAHLMLKTVGNEPKEYFANYELDSNGFEDEDNTVETYVYVYTSNGVELTSFRF